MTDYFALLAQPRRPWLDPAKLEEQFHALSKQFHPDKVEPEPSGQADRHFAELNAAYQCLRTPKTRLGHLLELESAHRTEATGSVPPGMTNLFMTITQLLGEADAFINKWSAASPLLKAGMFAAAQEMMERLRSLHTEIKLRTAELDAGLMAIDVRWQGSAGNDLGELRRHHQSYSYYAKWMEQLSARVTQLMVE